MPDQQAIEGRAQAVDVAGRADPVQVARGLLGAHVLRRPQRRAGAGQRGRIAADRDRRDRCPSPHPARAIDDRLGEPPVDHERLAEPAEHDVVGLEVAVHDAAAVRVGDRVAGVDQAAQQPAEGDLAPARLARGVLLGVEPLDRAAEGLALDQPHRVVRPPVGISAQAVDRHDPRMLQPPGEPGLEQEPRLAGRVVRVVRPQLLHRDLAIELRVDRQEDLAQPPARMGPHDPEPLVDRRRGGRAIGRGTPAAPVIEGPARGGRSGVNDGVG